MAKKSETDLAALQRMFKKELEKKPIKKTKAKNVILKTTKKTNTVKRGSSRKTTTRSSRKRKPKKKLFKKAVKISKKRNNTGRKAAKTSKVSKKNVRVRSEKTTVEGKGLKVTRKTSTDYRGDKSFFLHIDLKPFKKFKEKINAIRNWSGNGVKHFLDLKYPMFPRAFMVILITMKKGKGNEPYERANKMSANDINVDVPNIKNLILEYMVAFQDNFLEYFGDEQNDSDWVYDPQKIVGIAIRFFYALPEKEKIDPITNPTFDI